MVPDWPSTRRTPGRESVNGCSPLFDPPRFWFELDGWSMSRPRVVLGVGCWFGFGFAGLFRFGAFDILFARPRLWSLFSLLETGHCRALRRCYIHRREVTGPLLLVCLFVLFWVGSVGVFGPLSPFLPSCRRVAPLNRGRGAPADTISVSLASPLVWI